MRKITIVANVDNQFVCSVRGNVINVEIKNAIINKLANYERECEGNKTNKNCELKRKINVENLFFYCTFKWMEKLTRE